MYIYIQLLNYVVEKSAPYLLHMFTMVYTCTDHIEILTYYVTINEILMTFLNVNFHFSVWMQTAAVSSGVLVAKVMEGSTLSYYSVSLVADSSDYLFQFSYLPVGVATQQSVQVSFSQSQLPVGAWHSLCVVVGGGTVRFYTNGVSRGSR